MIYDNRGQRIINKVQQLLVEEFKIPVLFDRIYKPRNTSYFNIDFDEISDIEFLAGGMIRQYDLTIRYFLLLEGYQRHTHHNYLSNISERLLRLFKNNPAPKNTENTFNLDSQRWNLTTEYWNLITEYIYHSGQINSIEYNAPKDDDEDIFKNLHVVEYNFSCKSSEVDYEN